MGRPLLEVADVFRRYGESYRHRHEASMSFEQHRVMRAIELCRTPALGGHVDQCDRCGHQVISYNSCRNRHCPKCQNLDKALWRQARCAEILPVDYYHVVFTLPHQLAPLALQNKKVVYGILFQAASQTLLRIGAEPKHLGAELGFVALLHTWGRNLLHHPHVHCVVPGGGLAADGQRWIPCKNGFFLPVRVLSRLFRRRCLEALDQAFQKGQLEFHGALEASAEPHAFATLLNDCRSMQWVVYAKPPFAGPNTVLDYLARYTHRIAISNHRLLAMDNGLVSFTSKDYNNAGKQTTTTLDAGEFIRRFLLHVLPSGFQRIRYYGFLANRHRAQKLQVCRRLLQVPTPPEMPTRPQEDVAALILALTDIDPLRCPSCEEGRLVRLGPLRPAPPFRPTFRPRGRSP